MASGPDESTTTSEDPSSDRSTENPPTDAPANASEPTTASQPTTAGEPVAAEPVAADPPAAALDDTGTVAQEPSASSTDATGGATEADLLMAPPADEPAPSSAAEVAPATIVGDGKVAGDAGDPVVDGEDREPEDELDDDVEEGDDEPDEPRRRGGVLTKQIQVDARLILIITAVLALGAGAYILGQRQARDDAAAPGQPQTTATTAFQMPKDFTTFEDKDTGVKMSFPRDWTQYSTKDLDPAIRLAVGIPDTSDTIVVRVNSYSTPITQANVGDQKNVFDQLLSQENIEILVNQVTTLKGMPALFYVYRFTDAPTGVKGYHAHYFLFQGRKMVSVIFQALPEARYEVLAPLFDTIASTIEVAPGEPPAFLNPIGGSAATAPTTPGAPTTAAPAPTAAPPPTSTP